MKICKCKVKGGSLFRLYRRRYNDRKWFSVEVFGLFWIHFYDSFDL